MKKEKLKLGKYTIGNTDKAVGFRVRLEPGDHAELAGYAKQHSVTVGDVVASALRQCGVLTAP